MEDEDGYTRIDPRKLGIYTVPAPPKAKAPPPNLWWKIAFGISLAGNIALALTLIILNLPVFQDGFSKLPQNRIPSCLQNCVPCHSAKDSEIANLTLDPNTAFAHLYVSSDLKSVKWKGMKQNINSSPMRYDVMSSVLSYQGFNSKKICWEVEVVGVGTWWAVGIVRESANRNGPIFLAPEGGYWGVQLIKGQYEAITHPNRTKLSVCHPPKRVRVSLDYSEGLIAFFDGDTGAELFTFPKASFSGEKVHAWFLIDGWNGELTVHP